MFYCLSSWDHELHITVVRCSMALVLPRWVVLTVDRQGRRSAVMVRCSAVVSSAAAIWLISWLNHLLPLVSSATTGMGKVVCFAPVATVRHGRLLNSSVKCHFWQGCVATHVFVLHFCSGHEFNDYFLVILISYRVCRYAVHAYIFYVGLRAISAHTVHTLCVYTENTPLCIFDQKILKTQNTSFRYTVAF